MTDVDQRIAEQEIKVVELEKQLELTKTLPPEKLAESLKALGVENAVVAKDLPLYQDALAEKAKLSKQGLAGNDPKVKAQESKIAKYSAVLTEQSGVMKTTAGNRLRFEKDKLSHLEKMAPEARAYGIRADADMRAYVATKDEYLRAEKTLSKMEAAFKEQKAKEPEPTPPAKPQPALIPQPEVQTRDNAFSTFSLNVSDASFQLAAASLEQGRLPDVSTVRSEEFINAFDYRDPEPLPGAPLAFIAERAHDPFAQNRDLVRFRSKPPPPAVSPDAPLNIVLLLDKSGSMERADRVNIVREALRVLAAQLQPTDTLSIVTFARTPHLWADGVAGNRTADLIAKVSEITPEGGTNLEAALDLAYDTAQRHFAVTSINRVVLFHRWRR